MPASNEDGGPGPGRPRVVLRVGVAGHRLDQLPPLSLPRLHARMSALLALIQSAVETLPADVRESYRAAPPITRLLSSLAEGADRVGAIEGLALGLELQCPLPFDRHVYEADFATEASKAEYRELLARATAVMEMDGGRADPAEAAAAYEAAGMTLLNQCDVLIAVWDGELARGRGGTALVVSEAERLNRPTIWVNAGDPDQAWFRDEAGKWAEFDGGEVRERIFDVLRAPRDAPAAGSHAAYRGERSPRWAPFNWVWPWTRNLVADSRLTLPRLRARSYVQESEQQWQEGWREAAIPGPLREQADMVLKRHYAWADGLASYYANQHRSAFVLIALFGFGAVLLGVLGVSAGWGGATNQAERIKAAISFASISAILALWFAASRRRWHERWIDYRLLAEFLRQVRFLALLGLSPPRARQPAYRGTGDPGDTWMGWQTRAAARELGLLNARMDREYLEAARALVRESWVDEQLRYHAANAAVHSRFGRRLQRAGVFTFSATLVAIVAVAFVSQHPAVTILEAVLPAFGGSLGAIRANAELERLVRRSSAMAAGLQQVRGALDRPDIRDGAGASRVLSGIADSAANAMVDEVLDWRVVFETRSLGLPG